MHRQETEIAMQLGLQNLDGTTEEDIDGYLVTSGTTPVQDVEYADLHLERRLSAPELGSVPKRRTTEYAQIDAFRTLALHKALTKQGSVANTNTAVPISDVRKQSISQGKRLTRHDIQNVRRDSMAARDDYMTVGDTFQSRRASRAAQLQTVDAVPERASSPQVTISESVEQDSPCKHDPGAESDGENSVLSSGLGNVWHHGFKDRERAEKDLLGFAELMDESETNGLFLLRQEGPSLYLSVVYEGIVFHYEV